MHVLFKSRTAVIVVLISLCTLPDRIFPFTLLYRSLGHVSPLFGSHCTSINALPHLDMPKVMKGGRLRCVQSNYVLEDADADNDGRNAPKFEDTIFARSTPAGIGGVAVIRVSGPDSLTTLKALSKVNTKPPVARVATLRSLVDPVTNELLDKALFIYFPAPNSFTGEDVIEYHVHGGLAVVDSVLAAIGKISGLRCAERGEFTKRAFLNGRMDLLEAEAVNDLIHAETSGQQRQAIKQISGVHRGLYQRWRTNIVRFLAHVNAYIDYGESDGLEEADVLSPVREDAASILSEIRSHLADGRRGEAIRNGLHCTLVGPPNAGKSSLLNLLASRPAAIVSATPGTTRDIVQVRLQLGGYPVSLDDTAGLRDSTHDDIEREGMKRSAASFRAADVRILVLDGSKLSDRDCESVVSLLSTIDSSDESWLQEVFDADKGAVGNWEWSRRAAVATHGGEGEGEQSSFKERERPMLVVLNKVDLCEPEAREAAEMDRVKTSLGQSLQGRLGGGAATVHWLSCTSREGVEPFLAQLEAVVKDLVASRDDAPLVTRARHRELLERCAGALERFVGSELPVDIQARSEGRGVEEVGAEIGVRARQKEMSVTWSV